MSKWRMKQMFAEIEAENKTLKLKLEYANGKLSEAMDKLEDLREIISGPAGKEER